ncbi:DUF4287 domain-containing protein [Georgenia sp. Z1491]|uniref:DUF4287 domain-containing protein n=1 Tax=Georgenia sp. Z1491 TaxID=3416707 RepID=UPI003CF8F649
MSSGARSIDSSVSDEKVREATGRAREEWFALLDDAGATDWDHTRTATWLREEHGVDGWWAQGVTVAYEQARGLREPGQRRDGGWEASASKTLYVTAQNLWPYLAERSHRSDWIGKRLDVTGQTEPTSVRLRDGDERITLRIDPLEPGADGRHKVRLAVQHTGLTSGERIPELKASWKKAFATLADLLSES